MPKAFDRPKPLPMEGLLNGLAEDIKRASVVRDLLRSLPVDDRIADIVKAACDLTDELAFRYREASALSMKVEGILRRERQPMSGRS